MVKRALHGEQVNLVATWRPFTIHYIILSSAPPMEYPAPKAQSSP